MKRFHLALAGAALMSAAALNAQSTFKSELPLKPAKGATVAGVVECDGKPVAGVKVSDGYEVTKTDRKGAYSLKSKKQNPQVFITIPSGYEAARTDAVPDFWADFTAPADQLERHDFSLKKVNQDNHAIVFITDVHLANQRNDVNIFAGPYTDLIREEVKRLNAEGRPVYTLNLGDSSWDMYWYAHDYKIGDFRESLRKADYPTPIFSTMGNHDNDPHTQAGPNADFEASLPYQKTFGPRYYSLDIGGVHYVMLDNIKYINDPAGKETYPGITGLRNYTEEFTPEQLDWLEKDLADVPFDTPVVIGCHSPILRPATPDHTEYKIKTLEPGTTRLLTMLKPYRNVHNFSGHSHRQCIMRLPESEQNFTDHNISGTCGAWWRTRSTGLKNLCPDGTPTAFELMTVDGKDLRWDHIPFEMDRNDKFYAWDMNGVKKYYADNAEIKAFVKAHPKWTDYSKLPENYVYINLWDIDPKGKLVVTENGKELPVEYVLEENPLYTVSYMPRNTLWINKMLDNGYGKPRKFHLARVKAMTADSPVEISWTDCFGRETKRTLNRPAPFELLYNSEVDKF